MQGHEGLHALRVGAANVGVGAEGRVVVDQVPDRVAVPRRAETQQVARGQALLEAEIVTETGFRLQTWVAEEAEGREVLEPLAERWRLEGRPDAGLQLSPGR